MKATGVRWADVVRLRLRSLLWRGRLEQELDEELRFHFEALRDKFESQGLNRAEAKRMAGIEMGNGVEAIREECRDARGWSFFENLGRDIHYSLRAMRRNPLFTLTAAGALALGIGVNTALFTMVYSMMYRPIPVARPEAMRNIHVSSRGEGNRSSYGTQYFVSWAEFESMRPQAKTAELAGIAEVEMTRKDDPRSVRAQLVSGNLLPLIGGRLQLGRFLTDREASSPGTAAVVVLSHRAWKAWFAGGDGVIGKQVVLNRTPFRIIGVADEKTTGPAMLVPDVWIPLTMQAVTRAGEPLIMDPAQAWIQVLGRIRPGFTNAAMQAEMQVLAQNAMRPHLPKRTVTVAVEPAAFMNYPRMKQQTVPIVGVLLLAVALVLIVACANVANMLLARGLTRRKEIAIRLSIGAGRARLMQQLLTESVLLALLGGAAGLLLASLGSRAALSAVPLEEIARHQIDLSPDRRVLLFTVGVSLLTGIVFGLVPAWSALRFPLTPGLNAQGLADQNRSGRPGLQFALIAVQVAVCLALLVNAGLLLRGFRSALTGDAGQAMSNILVASFDLRQQQYTAEQATRYIATLRENAAALPGVRSASTTFIEPLHDECGTAVSTVGPDGQKSADILVSCDEVGPDFFRTMRIPLLTGREFTVVDQKTDGAVAVIDEDLARVHFKGANALGRYVRFGREGRPLEVVGVTAATKALNPGTNRSGKIYTPMQGLRNNEAKLVVSYDGPFQDVDKGLRKAAAGLDANVTLRSRRVEESVRDALLPARLASAAAAALGAFALLLAGTGIYGVVAFAVTRRRKEMGIRVALGADRSQVMRLVIWQGMQPVLTGTVLGMGLAAGAAQTIRSLLYGVSPLDPIAFTGMALVLAAAGLFASVIPARAALSVDPALTLRQE